MYALLFCSIGRSVNWEAGREEEREGAGRKGGKEIQRLIVVPRSKKSQQFNSIPDFPATKIISVQDLCSLNWLSTIAKCLTGRNSSGQ